MDNNRLKIVSQKISDEDSTLEWLSLRWFFSYYIHHNI